MHVRSNHSAEDDADIKTFCARQGIDTQVVEAAPAATMTESSQGADS
ncbi:hypothetical protein [Streptomyces sp. NPDC051214]